MLAHRSSLHAPQRTIINAQHQRCIPICLQPITSSVSTAAPIWRASVQRPSLRLTTPTRRICTVAASSDGTDTPTDQPAMEAADYLANIGIFGLWGGLLYYVFVLAPNQTPLRDSYFVEKLVGLGVDDGILINTVFTQVGDYTGGMGHGSVAPSTHIPQQHPPPTPNRCGT